MRKALAAALVALTCVVGACRRNEPQRAFLKSLSGGDFDAELALPGSPGSIAANGQAMLIANRKDPWGFMRVRREKATYFIEKLPIIDANKQKLAFDAITWNGSQWVAAMAGSWFQSPHDKVFATLAADTFAVVKQQQAPPLIGCIAWDGEHYWAATRKNTESDSDESFLYRLDRDLNVLDKFTPPGSGCQGLAWDGHLLWFSDVFSSSLYAINPNALDRPLKYAVPSQHASGVVWDGERVWVAEYDKDRLLRLSKETQDAALEQSSQTVSEAQRRGQYTLTHAEHVNATPEERTPETADVLEWSADLRDGAIYGSWRIYFGEGLFPRSATTFKTFVQYQITVSGSTLPEPITTGYEGAPGEQSMKEMLLASGLGPGTYDIDLTIHAIFMSGEGTRREIRKSESPLHVTSVVP